VVRYVDDVVAECRLGHRRGNVTAPVPPVILTPSSAESLVAPILPPLTLTALVAETMLMPTPRYR
jgi:hypothetical protein